VQPGIFTVRISEFCALMCTCVANSLQFMKYITLCLVHLVSQQELDPFYQRLCTKRPVAAKMEQLCQGQKPYLITV
jgi:hypothetical protein